LYFVVGQRSERMLMGSSFYGKVLSLSPIRNGACLRKSERKLR